MATGRQTNVRSQFCRSLALLERFRESARPDAVLLGGDRLSPRLSRRLRLSALPRLDPYFGSGLAINARWTVSVVQLMSELSPAQRLHRNSQ